MNYLKYFFNPEHLLSLRPPVMSDRASAILTIAFVALIIVGLAASWQKRKVKSRLDAKTWSSIAASGLTIGGLGLLYTFFAIQGIVLLAARFWLLLIVVAAVIWAGFIIKYAKLELPKKKQEIKKQQEFKKYIP